MSNDVSCPICHSKSATCCDSDFKRWVEYTCESCGTYTMSSQVRDALAGVEERDPYIRKRLMRYLHDMRHARMVVFRLAPSDEIPDEGTVVLDLESAQGKYTDDGSPLEKYENTVTAMAERADRFGGMLDSGADRWVVPTLDDVEAGQIIQTLCQEGYLSGGCSQGLSWSARLTPKGLRYAAELKRQVRATGNFVFVAACFKEELTDARNAIETAVRKWGYDAKIVDRDARDELIDVKIYEMIRASRFVVADLTCNRQSVYYEVGFAHGLGLQVILTCQCDHLAGVHFDLNHRPILKWRNEQDLSEALSLRLSQAFPRGPLVG